MTAVTHASAYARRRAWIEQYFDRTAAAAWARLTSDAPVSGIRATVRAGRDRMRAQLLAYLPDDLRGRRVLDAGCGPGQLAVLLARRGADVTAVDLSATLTDLARERLPADLGPGRVTFLAGDMLDPSLGTFDHVVAMDSVIHYEAPELVGALAALAARTRESIVFSFAPRTPLLALMHAVGAFFPRHDRAPSIEPIDEWRLRARLAADGVTAGWAMTDTQRIRSAFYTSQAARLARRGRAGAPA